MIWENAINLDGGGSHGSTVLDPTPSSAMSAAVLTGHSVCAVMVTFHPGEDLATNLALLNRQVEHIVIVDNGSGTETLSLLDPLKEQVRFTILRNGTNLGVAAALNQGCRYAAENGFAWIITFDQDSTVSENFTRTLLSDASRVKDLGMISPRYVDRYSGKVVPMPKISPDTLITTFTSGSLFRTEVYLNAGPFTEDLFIDCVDTEYCLRLRSMKLRIAESEEAVLLHSPGRTTFHKIFGKSLSATNYSPSRRYYIARNSLYVTFRYPRETSWMRHYIRTTLTDVMRVLFFEKQKFAKLRLMIKGVVDCLLGRMGQQVLIS